MRIRSKHFALNQRPFAGDGVSIYGTIGDRVKYRYQRINRGLSVRQGVEYHIGGDTVEKTARIGVGDSSGEVEIELPDLLIDQTVTFDVRRFLDDVECLSDNSLTRSIAIDSDGEDANSIFAEIIFLRYEQRSNGVCRVYFDFRPSLSGLAVDSIVLRCTSDVIDDVSISLVHGESGTMSIDTDSLDSGSYDFDIIAVSGSTEKTLSSASVAADADGPAAPSAIEVTAR